MSVYRLEKIPPPRDILTHFVDFVKENIFIFFAEKGKFTCFFGKNQFLRGKTAAFWVENRGYFGLVLSVLLLLLYAMAKVPSLSS